MADRFRFTDRNVLAVPTPAIGERWFWDTDLKGLAIRARANGTRTFILRWSSTRKKALGDVTKVRLKDVRERAMELLSQISKGVDPVEAEREERRGRLTVAAHAEDVLSHLGSLGRAGSYIRDNRTIIDKYVNPEFGTRLLGDIEQADIIRLHRKLRETPRQANKVVLFLSRMFTFGVKWGVAKNNPASGVDKYPENARSRVLTQDERSALLAAMASGPEITATCVKLIAVTGCRPKEGRTVRWGDLDLDAGTWIKPATSVKTKNIHATELSDVAVALLTAWRKRCEALGYPLGPDGFVFPGRDDHDKPLADYKKAWASWCKAAGLTNGKKDGGIIVYDLRRTLITHLMGVADLKTVMSISNHATPTVLLRNYAQVRKGAQKAALDQVDANLRPALKLVANNE